MWVRSCTRELSSSPTSNQSHGSHRGPPLCRGCGRGCRCWRGGGSTASAAIALEVWSGPRQNDQNDRKVMEGIPNIPRTSTKDLPCWSFSSVMPREWRHIQATVVKRDREVTFPFRNHALSPPSDQHLHWSTNSSNLTLQTNGQGIVWLFVGIHNMVNTLPQPVCSALPSSHHTEFSVIQMMQ